MEYPEIQYNRILELAKKRGIAVKRLCDSIGKSHNYIYVMRNGNNRIPDEYMMVFADALGTSIDYLYGLTNDPDPHYLVKTAGSEQEKLLAVLIELLPDLSNEQLDTLTRFFTLPEKQRNALITVLDRLVK